MSDRPILELQGVTQKFGGVVAASDVNMQVFENEIVGLIGPNGAGKTTIFNLITGIYTPTEGRIYFEGNDIVGKNVHSITLLGMARTFQNIRLFSDLTVLENILIGMHGRIHVNFVEAVLGLKKNRESEKSLIEAAMELLRLAGLSDKADDKAGSLPYGPQRELEILRAMATGAKLLLLDEPAAGMNEQETERLMQFIRKLKEMKYTILLIEHDMNLVMNICERIYVLNHGVIISSGDPLKVRSDQGVIDAYLGTGA